MCTEDLAQALAGDLDSHFERLVRVYQDRIYAFAFRLAGNRMDADEIAQDAFIRAYRALTRYPAEQIRALALRPWLYQIALNAFRNTRRGRRFVTVPIEGAGDDPPIDPEGDERERPESIAVQREISHDLATLLATLPERYRVAVVLRHVEGVSYLEAAAVLGQPVGTVKSNVHRGTRLLRAELEKQGVGGRNDV